MIFGVRNGISVTAVLIKYCNSVDKLFIKKGSDSRWFSYQILWRGVWDLNPRDLSVTDLAGLPPTRLGQPRPVFIDSA